MPDNDTPIKLSILTRASIKPVPVIFENRYTHPGCRSVPDTIVGALKFNDCAWLTKLYKDITMSNTILFVDGNAVLVNDGYNCFILVVCKGDTKGNYDHRYWK